MKYKHFMSSLLADLIPPKFKVGKHFYFDIDVQIAISLSIFEGFQLRRAQNIQLQCLESKNNYILLTVILNFKLRLINITSETPGILVIVLCLYVTMPVGGDWLNILAPAAALKRKASLTSACRPLTKQKTDRSCSD